MNVVIPNMVHAAIKIPIIRVHRNSSSNQGGFTGYCTDNDELGKTNVFQIL